MADITVVSGGVTYVIPEDRHEEGRRIIRQKLEKIPDGFTKELQDLEQGVLEQELLAKLPTDYLLVPSLSIDWPGGIGGEAVSYYQTVLDSAPTTGVATFLYDIMIFWMAKSIDGNDGLIELGEFEYKEVVDFLATVALCYYYSLSYAVKNTANVPGI